MLAGSGSNRRRIYREAQLVTQLRQLLRRERPTWRLTTVDTANASYAEEVRAISAAHIMVSLFGSSLHNCRFMAAGSTVIEIHGALKHDFGEDYFYERICARALGHHWVRSPHSKLPQDRAVSPHATLRAGGLCARVFPPTCGR